MSGKYDWRPSQGVRSIGDVFNFIVKEDGMLVGVLSGTPNTGAQPAPITNSEKLQEALKPSYVNLQKAITGLSGAHRRLFRKGPERLRPFLRSCSRSRRPRRGSVDLHGAGLRRRTRGSAEDHFVRFGSMIRKSGWPIFCRGK
jgi:hypothetical protein